MRDSFASSSLYLFAIMPSNVELSMQLLVKDFVLTNSRNIVWHRNWAT